MTLHLVSFGNIERFGGATTRVKIQASQWRYQQQPVFQTVNVFNEQHLQQQHGEFWKQHAAHIGANPRGFGYWVWKSYLVRHIMNQVGEDHTVFWMDVGCQLNFPALPRLHQYQQLAQQHGILCFDVGMPDYMWTKASTAYRIAANNTALMNTGQIISGIVMWKNNQFNRNLVNTWYNICAENQYQYITDSASPIENHSKFREHRHDQSVLSLLIKQAGAYCALPDETYFTNWHQDGATYPIWATRNPTSTFV